MRYLFYICFVCLVVSCTQPGKQYGDNKYVADTLTYAKGLSVNHFDNYISVEVHDPWDSTRLLQRYLLVDKTKDIPQGLPQGTLVPIPLKNIVVYTSVHVSIVDMLGEASSVIGVCEPRYMDTPSIQEGLKNGSIIDLGESTSPNIEKIIDIGAEVIIASPFQNSGYGPAEKLGIPIIEMGDYMESLPLGRTEWIKFYGLLFQKEELADSIFRATEQRYMAIKELAASVTKRPTVFSERRYGATWYIPAGESYTANFFRDAGADYIFNYLPGAGSTPLAYETVYDKAYAADFWLLKYNLAQDMTYDGLRSEYTPYENFDAFKNHMVYACNTGKVPYYEEFPIHPDYLLKDLVWIFHPELLPDYTPRYYRKMQDL